MQSPDTLPDWAWDYLQRPLRGRLSDADYVPVAVMPGAAYLYRAEVWLPGGLSSPRRVLPERVVVKVLQRPAEEAQRANMEYDAHLLAMRLSPYVAPVRDWGYVDDRLRVRFLVLDYLPGGTLEGALRGHWALAARLSAIEYLFDVAEALHGAGIVHGDLKPGNIALASTTDLRQIRLIDFGLAQLLSPGAPPLPAPGTPGRRAPEQTGHARAAIGPATDVFALAYSVVGLLWGRGAARRLGEAVEEGRVPRRPPDPDDGLTGRLRVALGQEPSWPRLADVAQRMTAQRPEDRPSAAELRRAWRAVAGRWLT